MQLTTLFSAASCTSTECNNSPGHNHWQQHQACLMFLELASSYQTEMELWGLGAELEDGAGGWHERDGG